VGEAGESEATLYPIVAQHLNIEFISRLRPKLGTHLPIVNITATAGPPNSGIWSRPDLALINCWRHKYQPHHQLDLYGFEVKRHDACDVRAVHECLSHTRLVHYAYLVWNFRSEDFSSTAFRTVLETCDSYGLGLITFSDPSKFRTHIEAKRASPSEAAIDEFIETRFCPDQQQRLLKWISQSR